MSLSRSRWWGKSIASIQEKWGKISQLIDPQKPDAGKTGYGQRRLRQSHETLPESAGGGGIQEPGPRLPRYRPVPQPKSLRIQHHAGNENELRDQISQKAAELERIKNSLAKQKDPTLPEMRLYMEGLYQQMKSQILRLLYEENQALEYMTLQPSAFPAEDRSVPPIWAASTPTSSLKIIDYKNSMKLRSSRST